MKITEADVKEALVWLDNYNSIQRGTAQHALRNYFPMLKALRDLAAGAENVQDLECRRKEAEDVIAAADPAPLSDEELAAKIYGAWCYPNGTMIDILKVLKEYR